ncbi:LexA family transcriptional regulator [Herbaspirillum sp. RTI4]|uniref:XRE family transcriptional regulator n=1 Tax=Herbaspirillum sp. RTI4 TaxID=3048640 RepID=UPI002AB45E12|nr:LexA family transcriptional regulator [Herbaspirillum sp. RTI4]MDY7579370.1 LexA family transcriptional regulator [Herbaspirillum sp. RTI4]MEA9980284.1 LexA family transcriptional regulator [Herbaspirillum sp. RTI4]
MKKELAQIIKQFRTSKGMTQAELGSLIGVDAGNVSRYEKGINMPEFERLVALASALNVPLSNMIAAAERQDPDAPRNVIALHPDDDLPPGVVQVPEYRISFSAGNGYQVQMDIVEESEPATYRLTWFQKYGINPAKTRRFRVTGNSMEPFVYEGDSVLVNLAENDPTRIIDGAVYAIRYGSELRVKRLFRKLDGTLTLRSENPDYKDEDVPPQLAEEHISIIGRVRDKSGAGGL